MRVSARPTVYEINTAVWLQRLGRGRGHSLELGEVPGSEWDVLAALRVDAVWLMGVWRRSPAGRAIALAEPSLVAAYRAALPDLCDEDVIGSPYCVHDYVVDERFGGPDGLAVARGQLSDRGLALILDYVPNHVAADHPWVTDRPQSFLSGSEEELARHRRRSCGSPEACSRRGATRTLSLGRTCCSSTRTRLRCAMLPPRP